MIRPEVGEEITANILIGDGATKPCRVKVLGIFSRGLRIEMISNASEVDLAPGVQTIIGFDRIAS